MFAKNASQLRLHICDRGPEGATIVETDAQILLRLRPRLDAQARHHLLDHDVAAVLSATISQPDPPTKLLIKNASASNATIMAIQNATARCAAVTTSMPPIMSVANSAHVSSHMQTAKANTSVLSLGARRCPLAECAHRLSEMRAAVEVRTRSAILKCCPSARTANASPCRRKACTRLRGCTCRSLRSSAYTRGQSLTAWQL